jgi:hypothetical protein
MNLATVIFLWFFLVMAVAGVLATVSQANKPRATVDPEAGCIGAGLLLMLAAAPGLVVLTSQSLLIQCLALWLSVSVLYDSVQFIRQVYGVRGPRTALSTSFHMAYGMVDMAVAAYILMKI